LLNLKNQDNYKPAGDAGTVGESFHQLLNIAEEKTILYTQHKVAYDFSTTSAFVY